MVVLDKNVSKSRPLIRSFFCLLSIAMFLPVWGGFAWAEDRALLIGVGDYQNEKVNDLPGIDLDVSIVTEAALLMGYKENQIKTLMDSEATLANVEASFQNWLIDGVTAQDSVLIYFSGHGTQVADMNNDEPDGADEVLVLHDAGYTSGTPSTFGGVLVDDRFNQLLSSIPSQNVLVLVDACQSGTTTKSLRTRSLRVNEGFAKHLSYPGMPKSVQTKGSIIDVSSKGNENYVAISAAQDDEYAIATAQGSIFTLGIRQALRDNAAKESVITPEQMTDVVTKFVENEISDSSQVFHPNLTGSTVLAQKPVGLKPLTNGHGPVWKQLDTIWENRQDDLALVVNQENYVLGDLLKLSVEVPREGYLNIVNISSDDQPIVLYPNKYKTDNHVTPGTIVVPTEEMTFDLQASEPLGPVMILAVLTEQPLSFYESGFGADGEVFRTLSPLGTRGFTVVERQEKPSWLAGKVETKVCQNSAACE